MRRLEVLRSLQGSQERLMGRASIRRQEVLQPQQPQSLFRVGP
jgi:hypothetical protein